MTQNDLDRAVRVIEESPLCDPRDTIQRLHRMVEDRDHKIVNLETGWRRCEGCHYKGENKPFEPKSNTGYVGQKDGTVLEYRWTSSQIPPYEGETEPDDRMAESLADNAPKIIVWLFGGIIIGGIITGLVWKFTN